MLALAFTWLVLSVGPVQVAEARSLTCQAVRAGRLEKTPRERHRRPVSRPWARWLVRDRGSRR